MSIPEIMEKVKAKIEGIDKDVPRLVNAVFQINIKETEDEDTVHQWHVNTEFLTVEEGEFDGPDATLDFDSTTFIEVISKTITLEEAVTSGRAQISGDAEFLAGLAALI